MDFENILDERVAVIASYKAGGDLKTICMPVKMRRANKQTITFTEMGLRHPTAKGKRMIHVFELTDGTNDYRLEFDAEGLTWTLTGLLPGRYLGPLGEVKGEVKNAN